MHFSRLIIGLQKIRPANSPNMKERRQNIQEKNEQLEKRHQMKVLREQFKAMNSLAAQRDIKMDGAQPQDYSFIFHLQRPNPAVADEIFSTTVDESTARDMAKINQEILRVIPSITKRVFVLKWVDSKGTERRVPNDEALMNALDEMGGPIYK